MSFRSPPGRPSLPAAFSFPPWISEYPPAHFPPSYCLPTHDYPILDLASPAVTSFVITCNGVARVRTCSSRARPVVRMVVLVEGERLDELAVDRPFWRCAPDVV